MSASTPVKNDRSAGRIDMSSSNISPIHGDCRTSLRVLDGRASPAAAAPIVRPASGRSAMDLYAAIHESKKRLLGQQPVAAVLQSRSQTPVTAVLQSRSQTPVAAVLQQRSQTPVAALLQQRSPVSPATTNAARTPERQSDRTCKPRDDRSARYDFKRLLLQTNMAGGRRAQQSAVVRLQQPAQPPPTRTTPVTATGKRGSSWKSNVLSSTIQEDCREDEDYYRCAADVGVPRSASLVSRTLKGLNATAASTCSALETAL